MDIDLQDRTPDQEALLNLLCQLRFTGRILNLKPGFGFANILLAEHISIFLSRDIVKETTPYEDLRPGDLISFRVHPSKKHPGKLGAFNVRRASENTPGMQLETDVETEFRR